AYELFSGRPPFAGDNPLQILEQLRTVTPPRLSELDPSLPPELADIVDRAIRKEPEERFADLGQMGRELEAVQRRLGGGPKPVQTATVVSPTGAVAESASPRSEIDPAESAERWPSRGVPTAWDPDETSVSRAPRIAIATGVAIAAIVIAAFYYWQTPTVPTGGLADKPAAPASSADAVKKVSEERTPANEISLPALADATRSAREIKQRPSAAPASPRASKTDRPSPPARERDKAPAVA